MSGDFICLPNSCEGCFVQCNSIRVAPNRNFRCSNGILPSGGAQLFQNHMKTSCKVLCCFSELEITLFHLDQNTHIYLADIVTTEYRPPSKSTKHKSWIAADIHVSGYQLYSTLWCSSMVFTRAK